MKLVEVYKHIRLDTNTVFYVGIGTSLYRKYDKHGRNAYWKNIVKLAGYRVELNIKHLTLWRQLTGISKNKTTLEVLCV
jgi:hypothetical protein